MYKINTICLTMFFLSACAMTSAHPEVFAARQLWKNINTIQDDVYSQIKLEYSTGASRESITTKWKQVEQDFNRLAAIYAEYLETVTDNYNKTDTLISVKRRLIVQYNVLIRSMAEKGVFIKPLPDQFFDL